MAARFGPVTSGPSVPCVAMRPSAVALAGVCLLGAIWSLPAGSAVGQTASPQDGGQAQAPGVLFSADEVHQDRETGTISARGNVEVIYEERILLADTITYNTRTDVITATGNVSLLEPDGNVLFADYFEITGSMSDGNAENLRVLLADESRLASRRGRRSSGVRQELEDAVYSPCDLCEDDPERAPLWQVRAGSVVHDQERQQITYRHAWLDLWGVPVAYTPYLSHADPTVRRRSGFLAPTFAGTSQLGTAVQTPYYFNIAPEQDATFSPIFTTDEGVVLAGEYRRLYRDGSVVVDGSITQDSDNRTRGHIDLDSRFDIDETWRAGLDVQRASDDTYRRRYGFTSPNWLTTHGRVEGFDRRSYAAVDAYSFQSQRSDVSDSQAPLILPQLSYNRVSDPGAYGAYTTFDGDFLVLQRQKGSDMRRLSAKGGWHLPYIAPAGDIYTLSATVRGDLYHVDGTRRPDGSAQDGFAGRVHPQLDLNWRYPLERREGTLRQVFEPMLGVSVSPRGGNPSKIPNEDSLSFEFDETNLFSPSRFTGLDRVDGGPRLNYGFNWGVYGPRGGYTALTLGQSFRPTNDALYGPDSGLSERLSDYVGALSVSPVGNLDLHYRFRLDKSNFSAKRNEVAANIGPAPLRLGLNYIFVKQDTTTTQEFGDREEISATLSSAFTRYWTATGYTRHDLTPGGGAIHGGLRMVYEDECLIFTTSLDRDFTRDRDHVGGTTIMFRVVFKSLGEAETRVEPDRNLF